MHRRVAGTIRIEDDFKARIAAAAQHASKTAHAFILETNQILTQSPLIAWPVKDGKHELVIGLATRGYVALYRYAAAIDTVFVLAMRAQHKDGFTLAP